MGIAVDEAEQVAAGRELPEDEPDAGHGYASTNVTLETICAAQMSR